MESSNDACDFRSCTPTFQRVLYETGTSLNDCSRKIAESVGPFSAVDVYIMQPNMFTSVSCGIQAIELAKRVVDARASLPSRPGSVRGGDNAFSEVVIDSLFKQKLPKLKPFELGEVSGPEGGGGTSGQREARLSIDAMVTELMALMDDSVRGRFLPYYSTLPADVQPTCLSGESSGSVRSFFDSAD